MLEKSKPRKTTHQGGTEYVDFSPDGVNTNLKEYSLLFKDYKLSILALDSSLTSFNGTTCFYWDPFNGVDNTEVASLFICDEWEVGYDSVGYYTLSATFKQVPA